MKETIIEECFGGQLRYANKGMLHGEEEEIFFLNKGDKVIIVRKIKKKRNKNV